MNPVISSHVLAPARRDSISMPCSAAGAIRPPKARWSFPNPIPHRKTLNPAVFDGILIQLAVLAGDSHRVGAELQAGLFIGCFRFQHSIAGFLRATRFGDDHTQGLAQPRPNSGQNPIHPSGSVLSSSKAKADPGWITQCIGTNCGPRADPRCRSGADSKGSPGLSPRHYGPPR